MKITNKNLIIGLIVVSLISITSTLYVLFNTQKIGYFDYHIVYNECSLKQKLEKDLQYVTNSRKSQLDSLQVELSFLSEKIKTKVATTQELSDFETLKNRYLTFQQKYEEENIQLKETYFNQIRKEINDKAKIYAVQNGLDYFFAATGDGSLMYASDKEDRTEAFKKFMDKQ